MKARTILAIVSRLLTAVITLVILSFALIFAQVIVTQMIYVRMRPRFPESQPTSAEWRPTATQKSVLADGTIHVTCFPFPDIQENNLLSDLIPLQVCDVNGNVIWEGIEKNNPYTYLSWAEITNHYYFNGLFLQSLREFTGDFSRVLEIPLQRDGRTTKVWRYDVERQVFAGFSPEGVRIGWLGAGGFAENESSAEPFGEFGSLMCWTGSRSSAVRAIWQTRTRVYEVDFEGRTAELLFESPTPIKSITEHRWLSPLAPEKEKSDIKYRPLIHCTTEDKSDYLILREPNQIVALGPRDKWQTGSILLTATDHDIFLHFYDRNWRPPVRSRYDDPQAWNKYSQESADNPQPYSVQIYKVAGDGKVELVSRFDWVRPAHARLVEDDAYERIIRVTSVVSPGVYEIAWRLYASKLERMYRDSTSRMREYAGFIVQWHPRSYVVTTALSAVLFAAGVWHGWPRRTSGLKFVLWLVLIIAFGLVGFLTYWALNHTPVIKCPVCGKKRGLERIGCVRCGGELPQPQRRSTDLILAGQS